MNGYLVPPSLAHFTLLNHHEQTNSTNEPKTPLRVQLIREPSQRTCLPDRFREKFFFSYFKTDTDALLLCLVSSFPLAKSWWQIVTSFNFVYFIAMNQQIKKHKYILILFFPLSLWLQSTTATWTTPALPDWPPRASPPSTTPTCAAWSARSQPPSTRPSSAMQTRMLATSSRWSGSRCPSWSTGSCSSSSSWPWRSPAWSSWRPVLTCTRGVPPSPSRRRPTPPRWPSNSRRRVAERASSSQSCKKKLDWRLTNSLRLWQCGWVKDYYREWYFFKHVLTEWVIYSKLRE